MSKTNKPKIDRIVNANGTTIAEVDNFLKGSIAFDDNPRNLKVASIEQTDEGYEVIVEYKGLMLPIAKVNFPCMIVYDWTNTEYYKEGRKDDS